MNLFERIDRYSFTDSFAHCAGVNEIRLQWVPLHRHRVASSRLIEISAPARTDIDYRDIFWAPTPLEWTYPKSTFIRVEIPMLHYFGADSDLSFVGRENCGHMRVDVDLLTPFDVLWNPRNGYILVSLPLMARWHSSKRFNAERILRQSGKFDYSTPQFFHVYNKHTYYDEHYWDVWRDRNALK